LSPPTADSLPPAVTTDAGAVSDKRGTGVATSIERLRHS
jgi:hypothetical protein